jgi:hypothetical protein
VTGYGTVNAKQGTMTEPIATMQQRNGPRPAIPGMSAMPAICVALASPLDGLDRQVMLAVHQEQFARNATPLN